ncbi:hypothetical protein AJ88_15875 [Mesorhizobium amorphae CCBAU 01583]|nr:hypothetical protein AJ88_15875 [Mesorhizobium amorphae CCBAU 01583]
MATAEALRTGKRDASVHYSARLARAHATHLKETASFYAASRCGNAFGDQITIMVQDAARLTAFADRFEKQLVLVAGSTGAAFAPKTRMAMAALKRD